MFLKRLATAIDCAVQCDAEADDLARAVRHAARCGRVDPVLELEMLMDAISNTFAELEPVRERLRRALQDARGDDHRRVAYALPPLVVGEPDGTGAGERAMELGREVDAALDRWLAEPGEVAPPRAARAGRC